MLEYFRHKYPYTDFHELNLDWFLGEFKVIMDRVDAIDARLTQAEADIDELQAEVLDLNERVEALSEALDILTNRVDNAEEDIATLQNRLTLAEGSISNLLSRMTEVETAVASVTARVTTAEGDIDTLGTDLSALTTRVDTAEDDIDALETRVGSDESFISGLSNRLSAAETTLATKSTVTITPTLQSGTKVADYTIDGTNGSLYAPTATASGITNVTGSNSATVTVANDVANVDVSYITTGKAVGTTPATASTVEGTNNTVNGMNGHAEGSNNTVGAPNSHAEGYGNTTSANNAHVGGNNSVAGGVSSFAHGDNTKTTNTGECAVGSFNKSDNMTRFSVGGGTADNNRSNLFEVTSAGSAMVSGELHTEDDVYIGGQNIYINNANDVQKELSIDANNQLCIDSVPVTGDEFVFTITPPSLSDGMRIENSSDKTASEIITAYNNGKTIIGVMKFNQQDYFFNLISNVAGAPVTKITISGFNSDRTIPSFFELSIDSSNGAIQIGWSPDSSKARIYRAGDLATTIASGLNNPPTTGAVYDAIQNIPTYTLPTATANDLGGIKVGSGLSIDGNGVLSASGGSDEFVFTMTPSTLADNMRIENSSDKTASEILTAYNSGKTIIGVLKWNNQEYFFNLVSNVVGSPVTQITISGFNSDRTSPSFYDLTINSNNGMIMTGKSPASNKGRIYCDGDLATTITNTGNPPTSAAVYNAIQNIPTYTLPTASANDLGGIKVGSGLSIDANGVLSASGGSVPELTTERVVATLNGTNVYEKTIALTGARFSKVTGQQFVSCQKDVSSANVVLDSIIDYSIWGYQDKSDNERIIYTDKVLGVQNAMQSSTINIGVANIGSYSHSITLGDYTITNNVLTSITAYAYAFTSTTVDANLYLRIRYTKPTA